MTTMNYIYILLGVTAICIVVMGCQYIKRERIIDDQDRLIHRIQYENMTLRDALRREGRDNSSPRQLTREGIVAARDALRTARPPIHLPLYPDILPYPDHKTYNSDNIQKHNQKIMARIKEKGFEEE